MKKLLQVFLALFVLLSLSIVFTACNNNECTEHKEKWIIDTPATCTEPGVKHAECENCGFFIKTEIIDATGHNFVDNSCTACSFIKETEGLTYMKNTEGTGYIVTGIGSAEESDIVIPSKYQSLPVVNIGKNAFAENTDIASIIIPDSVTSIDENAFSGCSSLTSVIIPDSVTSIGNDAFDGCTSLEFNTYNNIKYLGNNKNPYIALIEPTNKNYNSYTIYDTTKIIYCNAFKDCTSLTSITIPDSVISIGSYAFEDCSSLTNATCSISAFTRLPKSNLKTVVITSGESIPNNAFYSCRSLTNITIPDSVTYIAYSAFKNCISLTNATCPAFAINYLPKKKLETVVITSGESIPDAAFYNCSSLTNVTIPESVTSIDQYAFKGCDNLQFNIYNNLKYLGNDNNPYYALIETTNKSYSSYEIHSNTKIIVEYAFNGCSSLTNITIPDTVTSIGNDAFKGCNKLQFNSYNNLNYLGNKNNPYYALIEVTTIRNSSYQLHSNTKIIANNAFLFCSNLTNITIPDSVTSIGNDAFRDCTSLTSITIPDSITSISESTFSSCTSLTSITIPDSVTSIGDNAFSGCTRLTSITIPDSVTSIGSSAFSSCTRLTSITIPDSVTHIGYGVFYDCTSLTNITIPDSVTSIGDTAFYGCTSLISVTIPNSVTSIGSEAFRDCTSLTSITIPDSVTSIGELAFYGCNKLTIYCELESKPNGWTLDWNYSGGHVVWGYKGE